MAGGSGDGAAAARPMRGGLPTHRARTASRRWRRRATQAMTCSHDIRGMKPTVACRTAASGEPGGIGAADVERPAEGECRPADGDGAGGGIDGRGRGEGAGKRARLLQIEDRRRRGRRRRRRSGTRRSQVKNTRRLMRSIPRASSQPSATAARAPAARRAAPPARRRTTGPSTTAAGSSRCLRGRRRRSR